MKKMFKFMKAVTLMLMAVTMLLGADTITANAQMIFPDCMSVAEDGRIKVDCNYDHGGIIDSSGRIWHHTTVGYPYCYYKEESGREQRPFFEVIHYTEYLDCYLSDYIKTHDESEWPSFVIKGSDGVPFYYSKSNTDGTNWDTLTGRDCNHYYVKYCYDEKTGAWLYDKSYKGPYTGGFGTGYVETVEEEDLIAQTKEAIANGEVVNGTPVDPEPPYLEGKLAEYNPDDGTITHPDGSVLYPDGHTEYADGRIEYPDGRIVYPDGRIEYPDGHIEYPDGRVEYPDGRIEYPDGHTEYKYADINTLGATVTFSTDCIKVKTNKKGIVAQKPLPKSVKIGNKALKRNKTFVVSYDKYEDGAGWRTVDAVTDEGIYRLVITGRNGYEGVYMKRLYVTADKTIKAMSSVSVKVNKIHYSGQPITSGVIKNAKSGKRALKEGVDYTVTYMNNVDSGTGQVTLTAIEGSGLLGTKTVNFTITGLNVNKVKVTGLKALVYDPNAEMVQNMDDVQLTHSNGNHLSKDDFTVTYANNTKAGTAKMVFTGKGLYNGTLTKTFKITKAQLNDSMLDEASKNIELTYTGKVQKPDVRLTNGGTELKKGTDYTLAYSNNVKVSTEVKPAWITVKGKGSYSGSFKVSFSIVSEGDDNVAKPNTGVNTVMTEEVPEEDDTVSGNDIPETDDTVSGNDLPEEDDTVSGNDIPDETPAEDDLPVEDETPASDETSDDVSVVDETPAVDEAPAADETTDETPAEDDTVSGNSLTEDTVEDEPTVEDPASDVTAAEESTFDEETVTEEKTVVEEIILSVGLLTDSDYEDYEQYFESYDEKYEKYGKNKEFDNTDDAMTKAVKYVEDGEDGSYAVIIRQGKIVYGLIKTDGSVIKLNIIF